MKSFQLYFSALLVVFSQAGCRKFVEIDPPKTLLVTTNAFLDDATATSTVMGIYADMVDKDFLTFRMSVFPALLADELQTSYDGYLLLYQNNLVSTDPPVSLIWLDAYNFIYQANAVYEGCDKSTSLTVAVKKQLMAEARFIRAFWYFYLVNLYGDVPLITTVDYATNSLANRTARETVYDQIITDLQYAQTNLSENYVGSNSVSATTDRVRPNKASATALLARVYLYTDNFAFADVQASLLISQTIYEIVDPPSTFLANSKEAIWQLMKPTPSTINTHEGYSYILTSKPIVGSERQSSIISPQLLSAFEEGDLRKSNWIGLISDVSGDYYYPYKYKVISLSPAIEHSIVLRLAEQYLIRAEARAELGNLPGAIADVDVIRKRAGIKLIKDERPDIGKADLLKIILKERQTELFAEWGHRWLDLKRTKQIDSVMKMVTPLKGGIWKETKQLWPIPQKEIASDANLTQNPGYN